MHHTPASTAAPQVQHQHTADGVDVLSLPLPVPGLGFVPANAFVVDGPEPLLVDTGVAAFGGDFLRAFAAAIDLASVRWIWLTHTDPDHTGCLGELLRRAPEAQLVTTFLGAAKLGLQGLQPDRVRLLEVGERLRLPDRELLALRPPTYDAPETTGLFDERSGVLFAADCFGAVLPRADGARLTAGELASGIATWAAIDTPWLGDVDDRAFARALASVRRLPVRSVCGSHLPPDAAPLDDLLQHLDAARRRLCAAAVQAG